MCLPPSHPAPLVSRRGVNDFDISSSSGVAQVQDWFSIILIGSRTSSAGRCSMVEGYGITEDPSLLLVGLAVLLLLLLLLLPLLLFLLPLLVVLVARLGILQVVRN